MRQEIYDQRYTQHLPRIKEIHDRGGRYYDVIHSGISPKYLDRAITEFPELWPLAYRHRRKGKYKLVHIKDQKAELEHYTAKVAELIKSGAFYSNILGAGIGEVWLKRVLDNNPEFAAQIEDNRRKHWESLKLNSPKYEIKDELKACLLKNMTLREMGKQFSVTGERVRQIINAIPELREIYKASNRVSFPLVSPEEHEKRKRVISKAFDKQMKLVAAPTALWVSNREIYTKVAEATGYSINIVEQTLKRLGKEPDQTKSQYDWLTTNSKAVLKLIGKSRSAMQITNRLYEKYSGSFQESVVRAWMRDKKLLRARKRVYNKCLVEYNGEQMSLIKVAKLTGQPYPKLRYYVALNGYSLKDALAMPSIKKNRVKIKPCLTSDLPATKEADLTGRPVHYKRLLKQVRLTQNESNQRRASRKNRNLSHPAQNP